MARNDKPSSLHKRGSTSSSLSSSSVTGVAAAAVSTASVAAKRTVEWYDSVFNFQLLAKEMVISRVMTSDVPTDIAVEVAGTSFALHKFPLVSRSGRIRKLVVETRDLDPSKIKLIDVPGGAEVFELVAKFCYGINFEITTSNVAVLRCAAYYLNEVAIQDFNIALAVLHNCEALLPLAEELKIVSRCIDAVATVATATLSSKDQMCSSLEYNSSGWIRNPVQPREF